MSFSEELNKYMEILNCSTNDICKESGISYSLVNRYINNKRTPKENSDNFDKVVDAIYQISVKKQVDLSKESIYQTLKETITSKTSSIDFDLFIDNFNNLQNELLITTAEMSRAIGYDSSFVSRICSFYLNIIWIILVCCWWWIIISPLINNFKFKFNFIARIFV